MDNPIGKTFGNFDRKTWVGLVAGGLFLGIGYRYVKSRGIVPNVPSNEPAPIVVTDPVDDLAGVPVGGTSWPGFSASPTWLLPGSDGTTANAPPTNNDQWGRLAVSDLIAQGYSPSAVNNVVTRYLAGDGLTEPIERAWIDEVQRRIGPPPTPPPPQYLPEIPFGNDVSPLPPDPTTPAPPAAAPNPRRTLSKGTGTKANPDALVKAVQQWLRDVTGATIAVDGVFGPQTEAAVIRLQDSTQWATPRARGVIDGPTWDTIDFISGQTGATAPPR